MSVVVAGGGPAGAMAASLLARSGRAVTVLERTTGPTDKICGEFVSHEAVSLLGRIGLDATRLGGQPIGGVRLVRGARTAESALPFTALGLSRKVLDEALLTHAARSGAEVRRGCLVTRADATSLTLADGTVTHAKTLLLATGKTELRGLRRAATAGDLVGFKTHLAVSAPQLAALSGWVEVVLFDEAYLGLQRIEGQAVNLCLLVRRRFLEAAGGSFAALLDRLQRDNAHLRARLHGAIALQPRPEAIFRVPYGFLHRPGGGDQVFRLGDQAAVIPSFTGDGMAMALHSAALAARMVLAGATADAYHRQLRQDVSGQVRLAWWLYRLGAWRPGQAAIMTAAALWPPALRLAASWTRVPSGALGPDAGARLPRFEICPT